MELKTKRRTFKDVSAAAYNKGWDEGREAARKEFEAAKAQLSNVSLRKLAWSRLTDLFKGGRDVF